MKQADDIPGCVQGFDERILCPEGSCTGVIGNDGRCSVCKMIRDKPMAATDSKRLDTCAEENNTPHEITSSGRDVRKDEESEENFDPDRRICVDGSCIGVIGSEGNCRECGKPFRGRTGA